MEAEVVSAIVSTVLEGLLKALVKEAQHAAIPDLDKELNSMSLRVVNIKALLEDTSNLNNPTVQETLAKFRDLMYEAEDILTDCLIRQEYKREAVLRLNKIFPHNLFFHIPTCKKIQDLNRRIDETNKILGSHLEKQHRGDAGELEVLDYEPSDEIIGVGDQVKLIKSWVLSSDYRDNHLKKIGIVGMGGLGKTTIANMIFNDCDVLEHFDRSIKVIVSRTFKDEEILREILRQLGEESPVSGVEIIEEMFKKIISKLNKESCLIFLDDIWNNKHFIWWKDKFFQRLSKSTHKQSCIIITTRDQDIVADLNIEDSQVHKPPFLSSSDSWLLFEKYALTKIIEPRRRKLFEEEGRKIVEKCGGLPLAIKTIGALLGSKKSLNEWIEISRRFSAYQTTNENDVVKRSLELSYKVLPLHLKQCLLYFSIFPEDCELQAERLIYWWVGEGLIQGTDSEAAVELGFGHLSKLVSRCLVEVVERRSYDGRVYICKMHDLVRDLTLDMAKKEKLCCFDDEGKQRLDKDTRWLGFKDGMEVNSLSKSPKLRALLLTTNADDQGLFQRNLDSLLSLRALDLSNNKLDGKTLQKLLSWISSLKRLAYLNLSGAEGLKQIPRSIRKLRNLQLLVLKGCINLSRLNPSVTYLKKLLLLDLSCCGLKYLPSGLKGLSRLQELSGFRLANPQDYKRSSPLDELRQLGELRVLRMNFSKDSKIRKEECDVLSKLKKLRVLDIDFDVEALNEQNMLDILDPLSPPPELKELYLRRYHHETFPKWFSPQSLPKLVYLCLEEGTVTDIPISPGTWKIEGLCLKVLKFLETDWNKLKDEMPLLNYAEISNCPHLVNSPCSTDNKPEIWKREFENHSQQQTGDPPSVMPHDTIPISELD